MPKKPKLDPEYVTKLEGVIRQMLAPLKNLPFTLVIESISGKKVIPFDKSNADHRRLLEALKLASESACKEINENGGILSARVNEVGNKVETPIKNALRKLGYLDTDTPKNALGKKQATGYPDLGFTFKDTHVYIECKTYNKKNIATTQRSFYLSPTEGFKVTRDAVHLVISLEMERSKYTQINNQTFGVYLAKGWKIVQIENIDVDVKREFNSDNKRMYATQNIVAEGKIE